ncbi:DUF4194 domain-containing protein [Thiomicrorhabdus sp. 6S2-11]|uniref:DUF4194 domain-containing protein n=1 Tax=Thiomicrorhabdus marina TaxID=2818442 RepID=A0ABS3Q597_9GAMM|nr:DUF4194 domain-containing protein [Thiomicrorhabdus marina]MBO1927497.1 DUF4194 domain-containing protein [Thiomicrorhabdus marina]
MFNEVRNLLANQRIDEAELQEAFVVLQERQFLFRSHSRDKRFYNLIDRYPGIFESGLQLFGYKFHHSHEHGYIGYTPSHFVAKMSISESVLMFTLRLIYHLEKEYRSNEDGSISITGSHLIAQYKELSERSDLDETSTRFYDLIKLFQRKSIIRVESEKNEETGLPDITILPTIEVLVTPDFAASFVKNLRERDSVEADSEAIEADIVADNLDDAPTGEQHETH